MFKNFLKQLQIFFVLGLIIFPFLTHAAAPVTHVVLAKTWLKHHEDYTAEQKREFILGNLFPDIRYLGVLKRSETHEKNVSVKLLKEKQAPFLKGKRLHAFVDVEREQLIKKWKIHPLLKEISGNRYRIVFLKLLEDEILFSKGTWREIRQALDQPCEDEIKTGVTKADINRWHLNQTVSFTLPPSLYLAIYAASDRTFSGVPAKVLKEWPSYLKKYAKQQEMQDYVARLEQAFDKIFSESLGP